VDLDEGVLEAEAPESYVTRLARDKARAGSRPGELVLAADTAVVHEARVLGKPRDDEEARAMLRQLAGSWHEVMTGVALLDALTDRMEVDAVTSRVRLARMSEEEVRWYVATGEPADKAGAYAIQGLGGLFVEAVEGNPSNVVGLPLPQTYRLFQRLGLDLRTFQGSSVAPELE